MIRELSVTEVEQVSGGGFFGDLWDGVKAAARGVESGVGWVVCRIVDIVHKLESRFPKHPFPGIPRGPWGQF